MSYRVCCYHVVRVTRERQRVLSMEEFEHVEHVEAVVRAVPKDERVVVHSEGCLPDHVHAVASIPPVLTVAAVAKRWKGSTSGLLNERHRAAGHDEGFAWPADYGARGVGPNALPHVVAYVETRHVLNPGGVSSP